MPPATRTLEERLAAFLTPERVRTYGMLVVAVIFGGYLVSITIGPRQSGGFTDLSGAVIGADFSAFYWAGHTVFHGQSASLYDIEAEAEFLDALIAPAPPQGEVHAFVSPPYWSLFFLPLGALPYPVALTVFWILSAVLLLAIVRALRTELPQLTALGSTGRAMALSLCFFPVLFSFLNGQTSMLLLAVMTAVFVLLRRERDFWAGLVLGLLAIKPQIALGPVVILIAGRRWKALLGAAVTASACLGVGLSLMPEAMAEYRIVAPELFEFLRSEDYETWGQTSLYGLFTLALDPISHLAGTVIGNGAVIVTVIVNGALMWRTPWRPGARSWDLAMAASLALGLLSSPHLFLYDASLLLLPLAIVIAHLHGETEDGLLDGGPVLVATFVMAATLFFGPYLTLGMQTALEGLGLPRVGLQLCTVTMLWFVMRVRQRTDRELDAEARLDRPAASAQS